MEEKKQIMYHPDSIHDRTLNYSTAIVEKIINDFEDDPDGKYDKEQGLFVILSQLIYVLKHRWGYSESILQDAIADGVCPDE